MDYDLELNKVVIEIKKQKSKLVCIQLADGLKPMADKIQNKIEQKTKAKVLIWAGSCFGACDIPAQIKDKVDMIIQFGHSKWQ
ncbi:hypothetical protein A3K72_01140 [Candidatus Woesearchaeota archaeon RBG_13_36_6]|nr:MAG: hypothetical protein A3K72_01140 [Candidatus Woesearchaeota archaeon RBG_13_36_6]